MPWHQPTSDTSCLGRLIDFRWATFRLGAFHDPPATWKKFCAGELGIDARCHLSEAFLCLANPQCIAYRETGVALLHQLSGYLCMKLDIVHAGHMTSSTRLVMQSFGKRQRLDPSIVMKYMYDTYVSTQSLSEMCNIPASTARGVVTLRSQARISNILSATPFEFR